jgi:hypothetical protein
MGGQAPDMALDNEIEVDAQLKVFAEVVCNNGLQSEL